MTRPRLRVRWSATPLGVALLAGAFACEQPLEIQPISYLAVVARVDAPPGVNPGTAYRYRIREYSGTLPIDTVVTAHPRDTIVLALPPASYLVSLAGVPPACGVRNGLERYAVVYDPPSTAVVRYSVSCRPALSIETVTDGVAPDSHYVYRVRGPAGERVGTIGGTDTTRLDALPPGAYTVELALVASHCVVTSDGGRRQSLDVPPDGGATARFRIVCSDDARRPRVLAFASSYIDGASGLVFRAIDPDRDIERYYWDITDCHGRSTLPLGGRLRRGLSSGRTARRDTIVVIGAFEVGLPVAELAGRCTSLRVADEQGNTTPLIEDPIRLPTATAPEAAAFNARLVDTTRLHVDVQVRDVDGDFAGLFVAARLRDGALGGGYDGEPDFGIWNVPGYLTTQIPDLVFGAVLRYDDVYSVIVYLLDAAGNLRRIVDDDIFR